MSETRLIDNQWIDIVTPQPPVDHTLIIWLGLLGLLFILLFVAYLYWRRQPKQKLIRQLKSLQQQSSSDTKSTLQSLAGYLCVYFNTTHLTNIDCRNSAWPDFIEQLQQACYQTHSVHKRTAKRIIRDARKIILEQS